MLLCDLSFIIVSIPTMVSPRTGKNRRRKRQRRRKKNDSSKNNNKNRRLLQAIHQLRSMRSNKDRYAAIQQSNNKFIKDFCTKIKTLRNKKLSPRQLQVVKRYRPSLQQLASAKVSLKHKRKTLAGQKGGFIGAILGSLVIPAIAKAITG